MVKRGFAVLVSGVLFGVGLALSGMTNPARVIGFLDIGGTWDPTLMFVMAGALGTYALGIFLWRKRNAGDTGFGVSLPTAGPQKADRRLILGAVLFGLGWGISGICPGPALANLGAARTDALVFVPAMAIGMLIARRVFGADRD